MSVLSLIFSRKFDEIESTHEMINLASKRYFKKVLPGRDPTLIDFLVCPTSRQLDIQPQEHQNLVNNLLSANPVDWVSFNNLYNRLEIGVMVSRKTFVDSIINHPTLFNPEPKYQDISAISLLTDTPNVLLAIKYYCIYNRLEFQYTGLPAMTEPVRRATKALWGTEFKEISSAKTFTTQLASELNINEIHTNTALWLVGVNLYEI